MTENPDASGSLIQTDCSEQAKENVGKNKRTHEYELDFNAMAAIRTIEEDFGRQLELASDRQNTMVQSVGIILAFASISLIEVIRVFSTLDLILHTT